MTEALKPPVKFPPISVAESVFVPSWRVIMFHTPINRTLGLRQMRVLDQSPISDIAAPFALWVFTEDGETRDQSRYTLEVRETAREMLHAISPRDMRAEGIIASNPIFRGYTDPDTGIMPQFYALGFPPTVLRAGMKFLWEKTHGENAWAQNPAVIVLRYKPHPTNVDSFLEHRAAQCARSSS